MPSAHGTSGISRRCARAIASASSAMATARGISRPMSARQRLVVARPRAAVAASALAHEGLDARPVVGGGVTEWEERHATVAFRRCGDS